MIGLLLVTKCLLLLLYLVENGETDQPEFEDLDQIDEPQFEDTNQPEGEDDFAGNGYDDELAENEEDGNENVGSDQGKQLQSNSPKNLLYLCQKAKSVETNDKELG